MQVVAVLSGIGIIFSAKPFADAIASYAKNTVKYLRKVPDLGNNGILKKILKGDLSFKESKQISDLLKKTHGQFPAPQQFFPISAT